MSKKDSIIDKLGFWRSNYDKLFSALLALCAFTFSSAGGIITAPNWLIYTSAFAMVGVALAQLFIIKHIKKLQNELKDLK